MDGTELAGIFLGLPISISVLLTLAISILGIYMNENQKVPGITYILKLKKNIHSNQAKSFSTHHFLFTQIALHCLNLLDCHHKDSAVVTSGIQTHHRGPNWSLTLFLWQMIRWAILIAFTSLDLKIKHIPCYAYGVESFLTFLAVKRKWKLVSFSKNCYFLA